jgi:hypothetical protein
MAMMTVSRVSHIAECESQTSNDCPELNPRTHFRPLSDYEVPQETRRSFSITDGRSTTFPNRRFTGPTYSRLADLARWR